MLGLRHASSTWKRTFIDPLLAGPKAGLSPSRTSCISRAYHAGYVTHLTGSIGRRVWFAAQRLHAFDMLMSFLTFF